MKIYQRIKKKKKKRQPYQNSCHNINQRWHHQQSLLLSEDSENTLQGGTIKLSP